MHVMSSGFSSLFYNFDVTLDTTYGAISRHLDPIFPFPQEVQYVIVIIFMRVIVLFLWSKFSFICRLILLSIACCIFVCFFVFCQVMANKLHINVLSARK